MFLHIVQSTLCNSLLQDEVFKLMTIAVVLDSCSYFTEAVQEDFVICAVLLIIPSREHRNEVTSGKYLHSFDVYVNKLRTCQKCSRA